MTMDDRSASKSDFIERELREEETRLQMRME
jgi:hypothetical protein